MSYYEYQRRRRSKDVRFALFVIGLTIHACCVVAWLYITGAIR